MSRIALVENISQSYVKNFISKNVSKISETPTIKDFKKIDIKNIKVKKPTKMKFKQKNSLSTSKNLNKTSILLRNDKTLNPLITVYNNAFFPRSYKNKNYIKEMQNCLPPLIINKEYSSNKVLITDYETSMNKFNNIYNIKLDALELKDSKDEYIIKKIKNNKINFKETNYINKVLKVNQNRNYNIILRDKEEF